MLLVQIWGIVQILKAISYQIFSIPCCPLRYLVVYIFVVKISMSLTHLLLDMHHMLLLLSKQNSYLNLSCEVIQCRLIL